MFCIGMVYMAVSSGVSDLSDLRHGFYDKHYNKENFNAPLNPYVSCMPAC